MTADDFGTLHLPLSPDDIVTTATLSTDWLPNRILMVVSAVLAILVLKDYIRLMPTLLACLTRVNPNISLEHNYHTAGERNTCAWVLLVPFVLLIDRFHLYNPSFMDRLPFGMSIPVILAAIAAFNILHFLFLPLRPVKLHGDISKAAHMCIYTCFIPAVSAMLLTLGAMLVFNCSESAIRHVLLLELAVFYLLSTVMTGRILARQCSVLPTFLYLCALEIIPAVLIVASCLIF